MVVFGQVVLFRQKLFYSYKSSCIRAKVLVFRERGCVLAKMVVFGQKLMYSGKKRFYSGKVVVFV